MKQFKYILVSLILFLSPEMIVHSQSLDLSLLGGLTDELTNQNDNDIPIQRPREQDESAFKDDLRKENIKKKKIETVDFGYSGTRDFQVKPRSKEFLEPLKHFGYDFFTDTPSTFVQSGIIPVSSNYIMGPGDNVVLILFGNKNSKYSLNITREGSIFLPEIGPIFIAGLSFKEMKNNIETLIMNQYIGTEVSISLGELRSINIFVLGEATQPGMYTISALSNLTNAIFASGGIKTSGSLRNIELKRKGKVIGRFDFYELLLNGDNSNDIRLLPDDVVFIPPINKTVGIKGEVYRPAIYELKNEETLQDLISFSGNFKPKANLSSIEIERINSNTNDGFRLVNIDYQSTLKNDYSLENGDTVNIYKIIDSMNHAVLLSGHTLQPGFFPWSDGLKLSDIISSSQDLLPMTDLNYGLVVREAKSNNPYKIVQFNVQDLMTSNKEESNILLEDKDEIILFPTYLSLDSVKRELKDLSGLSEEDKLKLKERAVLAEENSLITGANELSSYSDNQMNSMNPNVTMMDTTNPLNSNIFREQSQTRLTEIDNQKRKDNYYQQFYEYKVFNYCDLPNTLGKKIVEKGIFSGSGNLLSLQEVSDEQNIEKHDYQPREILLANICRRQLLKPIMDMIKRNSSSMEAKNIVSVYGNVLFPGNYPLTQDMILEDAILASGGLQDATYTPDIELIRSNVEGKEINSLKSELTTSISEIITKELQALDLVVIKRIPKEFVTAHIEGEVFFPGEYPIAKNETLKQLIVRSGGLNNKAYPKAVIFLRESIKLEEMDRFKKSQDELKRKVLMAAQSQGVGETAYDPAYFNQLTNLLASQMNDVESLGRLVIDLEGIMSGEVEDIILENQDRIIVPKEKQTVTVIGEVFAPNAHLFNDSSSIDSYVKLSGGLTEFADQDNKYIIKADGSIIAPNQIYSGGFFRAGSGSLDPGDTIVIPLKIASFSGLRATTEVTQILYQMALATAAIKSF